MNPVEQIRLYVREVARKIKKEQKQTLKEEMKLRKYVRKLLMEVEEVSPHDSTGVNVLEDLLKTIIPILQSNYKLLTSDLEQRQSFRQHIINSVQNLLATESVYFGAGKKAQPAQGDNTELTEQDEEMPVDDATPNDPAFIDIDREKKQKQAKEQQPSPEDAFVEIEGEDATGRGFALQTFNKIQKQILQSYSLLGKDEDRETFYDYLITNLKLYFDKFEADLKKGKMKEPTTDAYEQQKQKIASYGSSEEMGAEEAGQEVGSEEEVTA